MLPLAKILVERHPSEICFIIEQWLYFLVVGIDYEIYLYDRAGHGFSSHLPKGVDCSDYHNHQDLRNIIQSTSFTFSQSQPHFLIQHFVGIKKKLPLLVIVMEQYPEC
jgi:hypothetical protein